MSSCSWKCPAGQTAIILLLRKTHQLMVACASPQLASSWLACAVCSRHQHNSPACLPACRYIPTDSAEGTPKCYQPPPTDPRAKEVSKAPDHVKRFFIWLGSLWLIHIACKWLCEAAAGKQQQSGATRCTQCLMGEALELVVCCNSTLRAMSFDPVQACARCAVEGEAYCAECTCGYTFFRFVAVLVVHLGGLFLSMATVICASCPQHVATLSHSGSQLQTAS